MKMQYITDIKSRLYLYCLYTISNNINKYIYIYIYSKTSL